MSKKYLIFGATGSIGSALAEQLYKDKAECHLIGKNEDEVKKLATKLSYSYSICNVLELDFVNKLSKDLSSTKILGIAYCVGSIDIKPFKLTKAKDFVSSYVLNLVAAADIVRTFQDNLKRNNGSVVLFSTVAAKTKSPGWIVNASPSGMTTFRIRLARSNSACKSMAGCLLCSKTRKTLLSLKSIEHDPSCSVKFGCGEIWIFPASKYLTMS